MDSKCRSFNGFREDREVPCKVDTGMSKIKEQHILYVRSALVDKAVRPSLRKKVRQYDRKLKNRNGGR